jgi:hypothetical protein
MILVAVSSESSEGYLWDFSGWAVQLFGSLRDPQCLGRQLVAVPSEGRFWMGGPDFWLIERSTMSWQAFRSTMSWQAL